MTRNLALKLILNLWNSEIYKFRQIKQISFFKATIDTKLVPKLITKLIPNWYQKWYQIDTKIDTKLIPNWFQNWYQIDTKIGTKLILIN